jgi:benzylsuccinate CoA-transferase BbsF subunit
MNNRPLDGLRIVDFGWILSIPHCCSWLGTMGAEVIRVESMKSLDLVRIMAPADAEPGPNRGAVFNGLNYSKKSITLNVASERGRALALDLVRRSDVVTQNYATGVFEKLGLGYETLKAVKPDIIMVTGSTLGTTGPERMATGWGPNVCAYAGLPGISGYRGGPPVDLGGTWPDYAIGTMLVFAVLTAVHHRNRTGEGQHVEVAMGEAVTAMIPEAVIDYTWNGRETPRNGNRDPQMAPHDVYPCAGADRWIAIEVQDDAGWRALCTVIGRPELAADPRFATAKARLEREDELDALVGAWTREHDVYEAMHILQAAGVAAGPVMTTDDQMADPHFQARGFAVEIDHPEVGARAVAGIPAKFSAMPELAYGPAPCLGEHNDEVFGGLLGLSREEIARLIEEQVIY